MDRNRIVLDEKVSNFKKRIYEQIEVLKNGIKNGTIDKSKISYDRINDAELFLKSDFFDLLESKRVKDLIEYLIVSISVDKEIALIVTNLANYFGQLKIIIASSYKQKDFYYPYEEDRLCSNLIEYLHTLLPVYTSELILCNKLNGLISDDYFLKDILSGGVWSIPRLKKCIKSWALEYNFKFEFEVEELFNHPFFKDKDYASLNVKDFKTVVRIRCRTLTGIIEYINELIKQINILKENSIFSLQKQYNIYDLNPEIISRTQYDINELFKLYDFCINEYNAWKDFFNKESELLSFGLKLLKNDFFDICSI